ncbi:hypothetical protein AB0892_02975 [Streptomyces sp. NPDC005409]|uniref:hypothetical protein n=1 Tax=Streptomyces sp. NPDC005409 TaxID=3155342 RepID=UPI003456E0DC
MAVPHAVARTDVPVRTDAAVYLQRLVAEFLSSLCVVGEAAAAGGVLEGVSRFEWSVRLVPGLGGFDEEGSGGVRASAGVHEVGSAREEGGGGGRGVPSVDAVGEVFDALASFGVAARSDEGLDGDGGQAGGPNPPSGAPQGGRGFPRWRRGRGRAGRRRGATHTGTVAVAKALYSPRPVTAWRRELRPPCWPTTLTCWWSAAVSHGPGELVTTQLQRRFDELCVVPPKVVASELGEEAIALGAIRRALDAVLEQRT